MEIKKIKCPFCEEIMLEHSEQGDTTFNPTYFTSNKNDFFPESITCVVTMNYSCMCGAVLIIPKSRVYREIEKEVKEKDFPCDTCKNEDICGMNYVCDVLKKFRKENPLSLRGRPMMIPLKGDIETKEYLPK